MISVPVPVKEALKNGQLKKNYRFIIEKNDWFDESNFQTGYFSPSSASYTIVDYKLHRFVINDDEHTGYTFYYRNNNYGTWQTLTETSRNIWEFTGTGYTEVCVKGNSSWPTTTVYVQEYIETLTIDNNNLVAESVNIDERMCSGDTLKFGLCEGSSLEFQYFGIENITGQRVQAFIDVDYLEAGTTKLSTDTLYTGSVYVSDLFEFPSTGSYKVYGIDSNLMSISTIGTTTDTINFTTLPDGSKVAKIEVDDLEDISAIKVFAYKKGTKATIERTDIFYSIPLGFFDVKKCSRQASTGIIKATCYNKLQSDYLDAKANDLLISNFDNSDQLVTVYDIRNVLLNDYEIQEVEEEKIEIARDFSEDNVIRKLSGGSITFKAKYGINTPLNYYVYAGAETSTSTTVYPFLTSFSSGSDLDATKAYHVKFLYDIEALEQSYYDEVSRLMTLSFNVNTTYMNRFMTYQAGSAGYYGEFLGWHQFFGVRLTFSDNSEKWYSTIAYNHGLNGVVGTFKDLEQITILNCTKITFFIPSNLMFNSKSNATGYMLQFHFYQTQYWAYQYWLDSSFNNRGNGTYVLNNPDGDPITYDWLRVGWSEIYEYPDMSDADEIQINPNDLPDFTLRDITSAAYETLCQFGQLSRITDLFSGVELNHSRLYPATTLYPATNLYPDGAILSANKSMYSKLWADEGNVHKWRCLIITYKGLDGEGNEADFTLQRTVNADGTDNYNMSDNWLFRNLIWTAEQVGDYADAMVAKMQDITWFPFEMWCAGLPYLETGDEIEISVGNESYTSYILQRQMKGIQNLQDTYINGTLDIF